MKYFIISIILVCFANPAAAATLNVRRVSDNYAQIEVSSDQSVNAVSAQISFDPNKVQVEDLNFSNSFCEIFVESGFNNQSGRISIQCGKPNPGITGQAVIAGVKLHPHDSYSLKFLPSSQVLANDGYGTELLAQAYDLKVSLDHIVTLPSPPESPHSNQVLIEDALVNRNLI